MINQKSKANFALFALAVIFFAVGVTEFISVGVLPAISKSFMITTSTAGLITTIYALGVALGAPILTILCVKINHQTIIRLYFSKHFNNSSVSLCPFSSITVQHTYHAAVVSFSFLL